MIGEYSSYMEDYDCYIGAMKVTSLPGLRTENRNMHICLVLEGAAASI